MPFLNARRVRVYPWLMLLGTWSIAALNLLLHSGWRGAFGQVLSIDFIIFYAAGWLYRMDIARLYDFPSQLKLERALVAPTSLAGSGPFSNPPYVGLVFSGLTRLSLPWALVLWSGLMLLCTAAAICLAARYLVPQNELRRHLTASRLAILVLASFPWVEGFMAGQPHGLMLLAVVGVCIATLSGRERLAGASAVLLLYKPQFALGYLVVWLVWRQYRAVLTFGAIAAVVGGWVVLTHGIQPYLDFLKLTPQLLMLPYGENWPTYLLVTPYGLLSSLLPATLQPSILAMTQIVALALTLLVGWSAYQVRLLPLGQRAQPLALAVLYPLLASPYALLHDLVILLPFFLLCTHQPAAERRLLSSAGIVYAGAFVLPVLGYPARLALVALLPLGLLIVHLRQADVWARLAPGARVPRVNV